MRTPGSQGSGDQRLEYDGIDLERLSFDDHVRMVIPQLAEPMHQNALWLILEGNPRTCSTDEFVREMADRYGLSVAEASRVATEAAEALLAADSTMEHWWHSRLDLRDPFHTPSALQ